MWCNTKQASFVIQQWPSFFLFFFSFFLPFFSLCLGMLCVLVFHLLVANQRDVEQHSVYFRHTQHKTCKTLISYVVFWLCFAQLRLILLLCMCFVPSYSASFTPSYAMPRFRCEIINCVFRKVLNLLFVVPFYFILFQWNLSKYKIKVLHGFPSYHAKWILQLS